MIDVPPAQSEERGINLSDLRGEYRFRCRIHLVVQSSVFAAEASLSLAPIVHSSSPLFLMATDAKFMARLLVQLNVTWRPLMAIATLEHRAMGFMVEGDVAIVSLDDVCRC